VSARLIKSYELIFTKFFGGLGRGPSNNQLDFGGDPENDPYLGIFKMTYGG